MTGEELRELIKESGKTQIEIAQDLGIHRSMISKALDGNITGWANAALIQYFAFLDVNKRLNVYPITKK